MNHSILSGWTPLPLYHSLTTRFIKTIHATIILSICFSLIFSIVLHSRLFLHALLKLTFYPKFYILQGLVFIRDPQHFGLRGSNFFIGMSKVNFQSGHLLYFPQFFNTAFSIENLWIAVKQSPIWISLLAFFSSVFFFNADFFLEVCLLYAQRDCDAKIFFNGFTEAWQKESWRKERISYMLLILKDRWFMSTTIGLSAAQSKLYPHTYTCTVSRLSQNNPFHLTLAGPHTESENDTE